MLSLCIGFAQTSAEKAAQFASLEKANTLLTTEDIFTESWSQFDIDSRMHKTNSTQEELFEFITQQTRNWSAKEEKTIQSILVNLDKNIKKNGYHLNFPEEIYFVKTTGKEEGGALGYTRSTYIVLNEVLFTKSKSNIEKTVLHEIFHVLSRHDSSFRAQMYSIIGFNIMNSVAYPPSIKEFRITNPDAPRVDSYIELTVKDTLQPCMMILYADRPYEGGDFFKYLNIGFLALQGDSAKSVAYQDNEPIIYTMKEVTGFYEQIGKNTKYIINPEEVMAENFVLALLGAENLPNQEIVTQVQKVLKG